MLNQFSRTQLVFGEKAVQHLASARVAVFGIGGVGGYTVEALVRSGIGQLDLIDDDKVCITNVNRQLLSTLKTVGQYKVDVAKERIADINPKCRVNTFKTFYMPDTEDEFDFTQYDYIVDAIDTVKGKLALVENAYKAGTPIISSMGAGNKPGKRKCTVRRDIPGSTAFVPSVAGLIIAGEVIKELTSFER